MKFIKNNSYLLLVVAVCIVFTMIGMSKAENKHVAFEKVVVAEGDTLWGYSVKYANDNVPADKWIKDIINLNNLTTTTIRVGDELKIPKNTLLNHKDIATFAGETE